MFTPMTAAAPSSSFQYQSWQKSCEHLFPKSLNQISYEAPPHPHQHKASSVNPTDSQRNTFYPLSHSEMAVQTYLRVACQIKFGYLDFKNGCQPFYWPRPPLAQPRVELSHSTWIYSLTLLQVKVLLCSSFYQYLFLQGAFKSSKWYFLGGKKRFLR